MGKTIQSGIISHVTPSTSGATLARDELRELMLPTMSAGGDSNKTRDGGAGQVPQRPPAKPVKPAPDDPRKTRDGGDFESIPLDDI